MPRVSVIIPTYNRANLLERTIRSVLSQTFRDFEIIVIDDASTDNTQEMLREKFNQEIDTGVIRYFRNEKNMERSRSRNKGIEMASGEYIALLDDDDIWLPDHLNVLVGFLDGNPNVDVVFSNLTNYSTDGVSESVSSNIATGCGQHYRELCIRGHLISSQAALFRKK